jgi:hypothetical protein
VGVGLCVLNKMRLGGETSKGRFFYQSAGPKGFIYKRSNWRSIIVMMDDLNFYF